MHKRLNIKMKTEGTITEIEVINHKISLLKSKLGKIDELRKIKEKKIKQDQELISDYIIRQNLLKAQIIELENITEDMIDKRVETIVDSLNKLLSNMIKALIEI